MTSYVAGDDMLVCSSSFHRQRPVRLLQHSSLRPVQLHSILSPVLHHQHSTILLFISQMMRYTCRVYIVFHVIFFISFYVYLWYSYFYVFFADGSGRVRPRRGPTVVRDVWQMREGERIVVECNQLGQPIKKAACLLTSFLGTVARRPQLCPLGYAKWNDMLPTYKVELLRVIKVMNWCSYCILIVNHLYNLFYIIFFIEQVCSASIHSWFCNEVSQPQMERI